jgi:HPt (histidine-containing phosphotransfer) domain-containing protein
MEKERKPRAGTPAGVSDAVERLRRRYALGLRDKAAELQACWERTPPDLAGLEQAAHRLAGSSGSFGHTEIGNHAAAIEELLAAARETGRPPCRTAIDAALGALFSALP